ncbi:hypothetical protein CG471_02105 [Sphingobium sp. IP1]|uniref:hypothetical protein n=1 Tax=Sphingobium sp. IP1 TaxID=2021637 RepID=UPI000C071C49|nr:hypothetical protein [Sphingobium sp. IP1]PHP21385.1 hypothetical protein CG471_02105 [Sphingobium sp. IP1]
MSKRPAFQFYPGDWRTDPGLRLCSMAARGLWMEMTCLMHEGEPYGHLTVQGRPISDDMLARLVGESIAAVRKAMRELEQNDVFSRTDAGVIYSRRMVRDEEVRNARAAGGALGKDHGAKGASHGAKGGRPRKEKPPLDGNQRGVSYPPPSSSSSSPSSDKVVDANASTVEIVDQDGGQDGDNLKPEHFVEAWNDLAIRLARPLVRDLTPERRQKLKARINGHSIEDFQQVLASIERSPFLRGEKGWNGVTFDWVLGKANFQKILEGNYDR